ncbi:hypothetical protein BH18ACI1_BH18ACI1_18410 [soil metagenome]
MCSRKSISNTQKTAVQIYKYHLITRVLCLVLCFNLLSVSVPVAAQAVIGAAGNFIQDVRFGFFSGKWAINFPGWFAGAFLSTGSSNQNPSVARIQILPGSVTVNQGEQVVFTAIGYDAQDEPLSGLDFKWKVTDTGRGRAARPLLDSRFNARIPGTFTITAKKGNQTAQVTVTVNRSTEGNSPQSNLKSLESCTISSRSSNSVEEKNTNKSNIKDSGKETENGSSPEPNSYDAEGRVSDYTQTVTSRESFPMQMSYIYDTLNRITDVRYPAQYGLQSSPRKLVQHTYDTASRLTSLKVDGTQQAGDIVYNAADQTTSINIGTTGANQVNENYTFDPQTGLLTNQKVQHGQQTLLDLSYDYQRNNSVGTLNGKTGHLSKIVNNLDGNKNREYQYDALGRLTKAKGGNGGNLWQQQYSYDRYGNRESVTASGVAADNTAIPRDGIANLSYNTTSNRIITAGFEYDSTGNQTRAQAEDGTWLKFEYDSANRLAVIRRDDGTPLQSFQYGATNARLIAYDLITYLATIYVSNGGTTLAEYTEFGVNVPTWTKSYVYLGDSMLSTVTPI